MRYRKVSAKALCADMCARNMVNKSSVPGVMTCAPTCMDFWAEVDARSDGSDVKSSALSIDLHDLIGQMRCREAADYGCEACASVPGLLQAPATSSSAGAN